MSSPKSQNSSIIKQKSSSELPSKNQHHQIENTNDDDDDMDDGPTISFLPFETINWMNKRRPGHMDASKAGSLVAPSRAIQLKAIFRGLDFDSSGEISLEEMEDAIKYVGEIDPSIDAKKINAFFREMDADGNGSIDFGEFLAGMSITKSDDDADSTSASERSDKMQQAFFMFANNHRRKQLLDYIDNDEIDMVERFKEFSKLFEFQFMTEKVPATLEEELLRAKKDAARDKKAISSHVRVARKMEFERSRKASLYFDMQRKRKFDFSRGSFNNLIRICDVPKNKIDDFSYDAHNILNKRMGKYLLNDIQTKIPPLESINPKISKNLRLNSIANTQKLRQLHQKHSTMPPISIRSQANTKMKKFKRRSINNNTNLTMLN